MQSGIYLHYSVGCGIPSAAPILCRNHVRDRSLITGRGGGVDYKMVMSRVLNLSALLLEIKHFVHPILKAGHCLCPHQSMGKI